MPISSGEVHTAVSAILTNRGLVRYSCKILKYDHPFRSATTPFDNTNYPLLDETTEEDITDYVSDWTINKSSKLGGVQLTLEVVYDPDDVGAPTFVPNDIVIVYERLREESSLKTTSWLRKGIFLVDNYPVAVDENKWSISCTDGMKLATLRTFSGTLEAEKIEYDRDSTTLTKIDMGTYYALLMQ